MGTGPDCANATRDESVVNNSSTRASRAIMGISITMIFENNVEKDWVELTALLFA